VLPLVVAQEKSDCKYLQPNDLHDNKEIAIDSGLSS